MRENQINKESRDFAKRLRQLMTEKSLGVRQAAKLAAISPSTLDDWRGGAHPMDYLAVKRLGKVLGVTLSYLLTGEDDSRPNDVAPTITEVFEDGGALFDGYAKITIQRLIPKNKTQKKGALNE